MFGLLRPSSNGMRCSQRREFNTFYCGLCKGLDHHHGTLTRGLLSYDGVFVALLADALVDEERAATPDQCRCPLLPVVHRPTVRPDSIAMTFAASVQMLLFDQWAADGEVEGKIGRGLVRRLSRPHADLAHARLDGLGVSLRALADFEHVQAEVEAAPKAGPVLAAAPTANALRLVFGRIASLPGGSPETEETLGELGAAIGNAIYWIDALEDVDADERSGNFNPCVVAGRRSAKRIRTTSRLLRADLDRLPRLLDALPLARHQSVLRDIVRGELAARGARAIAGIEPPPALVTRARHFVVAFAVLIWAWVCAVPRAWASADAGADDLEPNRESTVSLIMTVKNEADVTRSPTDVPLNDARGLVAKATTVRTAPRGGKVVAELTRGWMVQVNASNEKSLLIRFGNPKDRSSALLGWVDADAIHAPQSGPKPALTPRPAPSISTDASTAEPPSTPGSSKPSFGCGNPCDGVGKCCKNCMDPKACCDSCCKDICSPCKNCLDCKACGDCGSCCGDCGKCCK